LVAAVNLPIRLALNRFRADLEIRLGEDFADNVLGNKMKKFGGNLNRSPSETEMNLFDESGAEGNRRT